MGNYFTAPILPTDSIKNESWVCIEKHPKYPEKYIEVKNPYLSIRGKQSIFKKKAKR